MSRGCAPGCRCQCAECSAHRPAAPDTTGGELRELLAYAISDSGVESLDAAWRLADAVLALPALRDLIAERDTLAAQVRAVEGLAEEYERHEFWTLNVADIRRALGTPTTGGGE